MTDTPLLEMRGISKRFPGVVALDGVDLQIAPGEVVAVVGENGAGKSTLMKILGGVYQPDAGEIRLGGRPIKIHDVNNAIQLGIAFIHQELNVLDNLDIAANVFLGREPVNALWLIDRKKIHADTETVHPPVGPVGVHPHAARPAVPGAPADGGNRQGPLAQRPPHHHG